MAVGILFLSMSIYNLKIVPFDSTNVRAEEDH